MQTPKISQKNWEKQLIGTNKIFWGELRRPKKHKYLLNMLTEIKYAKPYQRLKKLLNIPLRRNCPNKEFFLICIFPYLDGIRENTHQKKLRIWTLFIHWTDTQSLSYVKLLRTTAFSFPETVISSVQIVGIFLRDKIFINEILQNCHPKQY